MYRGKFAETRFERTCLAEPGLACAKARSIGCATVVFFATAALNRLGFRLKL